MSSQTLETQLIEAVTADPTILLSDETLMEQFPGESIINIRDAINTAYRASPPSKAAGPYVTYNRIIYHILRGLKPTSAVKAARVNSRDNKKLLEILTSQIVAQLAEHGRPSVRTYEIRNALQQ